MAHRWAPSTVQFRIRTTVRVGELELVAVANLRRWHEAWKILNDGHLRVTCGEWQASEAWVLTHWDAVADALISAADAFVQSADWFAGETADFGRRGRR